MIKWGIIGLGKIAKEFAEGFEYVHNSNLVGIASKSPDKISYFKNKFNIQDKNCFNNYEDLISCKEIDIIYIALPHNFHFEIIMKCLTNNKNVLAEKPATTSFDQIKLISDNLKSQKVFFAEGFMYRYHPQTTKICSLIDNDEIGEPVSMESYFGMNILKKKIDFNSRLFNKDLAGGCIFDLGCYPASLSLLIADKKFNSEYLIGLKDQKVERLSNQVDIDSYATINFSDKFFSSVGCSFNKDLGKSTRITGTKGSILIHDSWHCNPSAILLNDKKLLKFKNKYSNIFSYEIESVSNSLMNGDKKPNYPGMTINETKNNQRILEYWLSN